ncbi:cytochrome P450 98A2 [Olea europaea subsp. europaea]|uniref:Cytochrome P450 98A2 n=1 Tax=Olea europaea subsp. europaea TaxID=158383 RepID=A0A8S0S8G2_OLEEU|nr:cytochrome P450 98A2 [Olea europaea subsp. europaea]
MNSEGTLDEQGKEFKAIGESGIKIGTSLSIAEHIPWLRWMFTLEEEAFAKHEDRRGRLTGTIMEEHVLAFRKSTRVTSLFTLEKRLKFTYNRNCTDNLGKSLLVKKYPGAVAFNNITRLAFGKRFANSEGIIDEQQSKDKNSRPSIQKAQEELDHVIGYERLMTELDFSNLPYLMNMVKESLRLHPPSPLMLPHRANANVKIGDYDIPKGSNVHVNIWAIARDPTVWEYPSEFRPERFLEDDVNMKGHDF